MGWAKQSLALLAVAALVPATAGFYLPGTAPRDYASGEKVDVQVNALTPMLNSKVKSLISYDFYDPRFHFCQPSIRDGGTQKHPESLGAILFGDRIFNSAFDIKMLENVTCKTLCRTSVPAADAVFINQAIRDDYGVNVMIDGLPGAEMRSDSRTGEVYYDPGGFPLGFADDASAHPTLNNHYDIYLSYHSKDPQRHRVVGVLVYPRSTASEKGKPQCFNENPVRLSERDENEVWYTYSVQWRESDVPWALRWDHYLHVFDSKIHFFGIGNSLIVVFFLISMVATILVRTVASDISQYNSLEVDLTQDIQEDSGWKLVHGEVFRTPQRPIFLSTLVGTGTQLLSMVFVTLVFALFGFLSPANRGVLATVMVMTWTLFSAVAGYTSARFYATMKGDDWRSNLLLTATFYPVSVFSFVFLLNLFLVSVRAAGAVPFGTMIAVLALYFCLSVPLCCGGYYLGMKSGIPPQPSYLKPVVSRDIPKSAQASLIHPRQPSALMAGILPFGAGFVEAFFILQSTFAHRAYIAFGFCFVAFTLTIASTATITFLFVYFQLNQGEYRWPWRSFFMGAGASFYVFLYGVWFWLTRASMAGLVSSVLYFGYLSLVVSVNFLVMGTVGYLSSFFLLRILYSKVRVD